MNLTPRQQEIIDIIDAQGQASISKVKELLSSDASIPTLNRDMAKLVETNYLIKLGAGRSIVYVITPYYQLFAPINASDYFDLDPDMREANTAFNHDLLSSLEGISIFTDQELTALQKLKQEYQTNITSLSPVLYQKELERLTIELSWKSSQIEGNTYTLLETERLFREKQEADNKTKEEAIMLLNHKAVVTYLMDHKDLAKTLDLHTLEEIHSLLIKDLNVGRNIRSRAVGITGTAYKPLDNDYQIRENLELMCELINSKDNGFEKALLAVVLISYIQPFEDGNKRTGRMISNALLIADDACPLSYRSVDSLDYKKAMLLFYEQNNLAAFKTIFIEQNEFGVKNYFR
ncbi:Fic family protein [Fulvivirgaceae bacterium BMA10]|uniref:Fic family protein n=1 Tax=Splendidivirga corallicola TaxID=3051826 RepID=A0ABT8KML1_9BACT|nr:Fic family protein [Fulvivirgaceae bacterium BMA10]